MVKSAAITELITNLSEVEAKLSLTRTEKASFFTEWFEDLPEITESEKTQLEVIKHRYLYHRSRGNLTEGTVSLLLVSPLLALAGFYDFPFYMKAEASITLVLDDEEEILRGRIDVLILQKHFWVIIVESKKTTISVKSALPQTLAYLSSNFQINQPSFAMMTNGDEILFVKIAQQDTRQYAVSDSFSPDSPRNNLLKVLSILKHISQVITA